MKASAGSKMPTTSPKSQPTVKQAFAASTSEKDSGTARKQSSPAELAMLCPAIILTPKQERAAQSYKRIVERQTALLLTQQDNLKTRAQSREQLAEILGKASEEQSSHQKSW